MNIFKTDTSKMIISILWGLGLATMFQKICNDQKCIIYQAVDPNTIKNNIYNHNGECIQFEPELTTCD